jgi:hypothetical protein
MPVRFAADDDSLWFGREHFTAQGWESGERAHS